MLHVSPQLARKAQAAKLLSKAASLGAGSTLSSEEEEFLRAYNEEDPQRVALLQARRAVAELAQLAVQEREEAWEMRELEALLATNRAREGTGRWQMVGEGTLEPQQAQAKPEVEAEPEAEVEVEEVEAEVEEAEAEELLTSPSELCASLLVALQDMRGRLGGEASAAARDGRAWLAGIMAQAEALLQELQGLQALDALPDHAPAAGHVAHALQPAQALLMPLSGAARQARALLKELQVEVDRQQGEQGGHGVEGKAAEGKGGKAGAKEGEEEDCDLELSCQHVPRKQGQCLPLFLLSLPLRLPACFLSALAPLALIVGPSVAVSVRAVVPGVLSLARLSGFLLQALRACRWSAAPSSHSTAL